MEKKDQLVERRGPRATADANHFNESCLQELCITGFVHGAPKTVGVLKMASIGWLSGTAGQSNLLVFFFDDGPLYWTAGLQHVRSPQLVWNFAM